MAKARLDIGQPVVLLGRRAQRLGQHRERLDSQRQLPAARAKGRPVDADQVAEIEAQEPLHLLRSEHVGAANGERLCQVEHVGLVLSGQAAVKMEDGTERVMKAGELFYVPPGHDSWVVGDEPYVSLHILGSEDYAAPVD